MKVHERVKVYLDKHNITQKELSKETKIFASV